MMKPTGRFYGNDDTVEFICTRALTQRLFINRQIEQSMRIERYDSVQGALMQHNFLCTILFKCPICVFHFQKYFLTIRFFLALWHCQALNCIRKMELSEHLSFFCFALTHLGLLAIRALVTSCV